MKIVIQLTFIWAFTNFITDSVFGQNQEFDEYKYYPKMKVFLFKEEYDGFDLRIHPLSNHRYEFGIEDPNGKFFFLYQKPEYIYKNTISDFKRSSPIKINTREVKGINYEDNDPVILKIFTIPGLYCLHFSSNFDTHPQDTYNDIVDIYWPSPTSEQKGEHQGKCREKFETQLLE